MLTLRERMFVVLASIFVGAVMLLSSTQVAGATPPDPEHKVTICHRTNSETNPYVQITVDEAAVDGQKGADHFGEHKGPIWDSSLKSRKIEWGDVIPPVSPFHDGLNWSSDGQAIYRNGCVILTQPTIPPTTTVPSTTTTAPDGTTTTTVLNTTTTTVSLIPPVVITRTSTDTLPATGSATAELMILGISMVLGGTVLVLVLRE